MNSGEYIIYLGRNDNTHYLTSNKRYLVIDDWESPMGNMIGVANDNDNPTWINEGGYILLSEYRNNKINNIINDN